MRWLWLAAVAVAVAAVLRNRWDEVRPSLDQLSTPVLVIAGVAAVAGVTISAGIWRAMLSGLGFSLTWAGAARVFFVGQLGKYLPGSVWPALAQMELSRDHAIPGRAAAAAVVLFLWVHLVTGAAVAVVALPLAGVLPPLVALAALPCLALLASPVLSRALGLGLRLTRRDPLPRLPDARAVVTAAGWALMMWSCYAVHLFALARPLTDQASLVGSLGAYAAAWCAGFILVVAPAGAGVREGVLVALLPLSAGPALAVALASRLLMTLADVICGGVTALFPRRMRHPGPRLGRRT